MTAVQGVSAGAAQGDAFARAHAHVLADRQIQFALPAYRSPVVPEWLKALAHFLRHAWPVIRVLVWIGLGALVIALLWMIVRHALAAGWFRRGGGGDEEAEQPEWRPEAGSTRRLLEEADALAAAGHYAEAARLVLLRSVEDIQKRRPGLVRPATTSRDLAATPDIPAAARPAFAMIAGVVEIALFADRGATAGAWTKAREAYADFARAGNWPGNQR